MWAGGEYQIALDDPATGSGANRWRLRVGGDLSRREYRGADFDRMTLSGHLGPRWLIGRTSEASVLASARQSWLSDEEDWRDIGARVEGRHRLNRRTTAHLNASRHERRYEGREHLHGPLTDISAGIGWIASPTMRIDAALGWAKQRTERERERNSSRWFRVGTAVLLPYGFTVGGAATLRWTEYRGDLVAVRDRRRIAQRSHTIAPRQRPQPRHSRSPASARSSRWCRRSGRPTPSCTAMTASPASCASCSCSEGIRTRD